MTPKDVVAKNYECFNTGDMETFISLYHNDVVVTINGMHRFSGTHRGIEAWVQVLSQVPARFEDFSVTPVNIIAEGDQVFVQIHGKAKGLEGDFGHFLKLENGKIKEFWIYDDSQKMAHAMKAV